MHISEGILTAPVLLSGAGVALAGTAVGLKSMSQQEVPQVAVLTATFFVASLVHVPLGPASIHLVLNGLLGLILGWACFPAILVALILQAIFFQYGGLSVLGVNTLIMALPALLCFLAFSPLLRSKGNMSALAGFLTGSLSIFGSAALLALCLTVSGEAFIPAAKTLLAAHIPVMLLEGLLTAVIVSFLLRTKPEILQTRVLPGKPKDKDHDPASE
ncbi:MAG: cobalt transporter CbiM [Desulfohalobiaceae bacterium]